MRMRREKTNRLNRVHTPAHMTLTGAVLGAVIGAPLGLLIAFCIVGWLVRATPRELAAPFALCWLGFAAGSPAVYWADKRVAQSGDPRFIVLKIVPYSIVMWLALGYLFARHGLMTPIMYTLLTLGAWWPPLALIAWRFPRFLRRIVLERHAAVRGSNRPEGAPR